jgi:hypothetical protein
MKYLMTVLLLALSACSNQSEVVLDGEEVVTLELKSGIITGSTDFGTFEPTSSGKMITFQIKNSGTESLVGPGSLDNSNFSLIYQNCHAALGPKKSCTIKVNFDPKGKTAQVYTANLNLDSVFSALSATVNAPPPELPNLQITSSGMINNSLDFGTLKDKQTVLKTLSVKNLGAMVNSTVSVPPGYTISYDSCSGKNLNKNASCQIKVSLSAVGNSGLVTGDLAFAEHTVSLSGEVITVASGGNANYAPNLIFQGTGVSSEPYTYSYGALEKQSSKQLIVTIKNIGNLAAAVSSAVLASSEHFSIVYNQCQNKSLAINGSCQVRILLNASVIAAEKFIVEEYNVNEWEQMVNANIDWQYFQGPSQNASPSSFSSGQQLEFTIEAKANTKLEWFNFPNNAVSLIVTDMQDNLLATLEQQTSYQKLNVPVELSAQEKVKVKINTLTNNSLYTTSSSDYPLVTVSSYTVNGVASTRQMYLTLGTTESFSQSFYFYFDEYTPEFDIAQVKGRTIKLSAMTLAELGVTLPLGVGINNVKLSIGHDFAWDEFNYPLTTLPDYTVPADITYFMIGIEVKSGATFESIKSLKVKFVD